MYLLMPFEQHYDRGFGAVADSFCKAADALGENEDARLPGSHLPINFLYRHAVELYLKSIILILYRLKPPGYEPLQPMRIRIGFKIKRLDEIHGVRILFDHYAAITRENEARLVSFGKHTSWGEVPSELEGWIDFIDKMDPVSTTFRYPTTGNVKVDREKSSFKRRSIKDIQAQMRAGKKWMKIMLLVDDSDQIIDSFQLDPETHKRAGEVLRQTAHLLLGTHFGMRMEMAGGARPKWPELILTQYTLNHV